MENAIRIVKVNTTAWEEEDFLLITNLSDDEIQVVIEPIVEKERNGGDEYDNDDLGIALRNAYPDAVVQYYPEADELSI